MHKIKIKINLCKILKRQINDFKQAKYLQLGLIVFVLSGLFSYFIVQNHIYAFNNEALITRELNNAKGLEVIDPVKKREVMKYATNFPKEGKWQSNNNLTIIKNGKAIQSQSMWAYSFPIVFNFLEKPRTKLRGRRIDHKLDKNYQFIKHKLADDNSIDGDGFEPEDFDGDKNLVIETNPDGSSTYYDEYFNYKYNNVGDFIYSKLTKIFNRIQFKRLSSTNRFVQRNLSILIPSYYFNKNKYQINHLHIYQSRQKTNQYLVQIIFKNYNTKDEYPVNELIDLNKKRVVLAKYNLKNNSSDADDYWTTYIFNVDK